MYLLIYSKMISDHRSLSQKIRTVVTHTHTVQIPLIYGEHPNMIHMHHRPKARRVDGFQKFETTMHPSPPTIHPKHT